MTKKVVVYNLVGHRFLGVNEQGDKVMIDGDQPATGPRPMELLLMALGACTAYDVVDIMQKKKQPLARYRVEVEGVRAETHPRRYTHITVTHIASGPGVTLEALVQYMFEQGLTKRRMTVEELFAPSTLETYKI